MSKLLSIKENSPKLASNKMEDKNYIYSIIKIDI